MSRNISRRSFVGTSAAGAAAVGLSGLPEIRHAAAQDATPQIVNPGQITITDRGADLPTDDVTLRWTDSGGLKGMFYEELHAAYHEAHPNISIQYDPLPWTEINRIVPLGIQNGDAHDIFAKPQPVPSAQMVNEGWVAPLDEVIPDFEEWKARYPFGSFLDGVHVFNGKTYTFPQTSSKRYWTMTFYNPAYMEKAGYDLESERLTWDQYREAARKVTEQGQGEYYGVIIGGKSPARLTVFVQNLARMAGASAGGSLGFNDIDWRTGEFQYTSDQYLGAIELLLALQQDGSIFPGSMSLAEDDAWSRFPQGVAGMLLEGPWCIPDWEENNPDFTFGLASQPVPNDGSWTPLTYEETGSNQLWVYSGSPYKSIAGDIFSYIGTLEGQVGLVAATKGNLSAVFPEANRIAVEQVELDPFASEALALYDEQMRLGPLVTIRNPGAAQVALESKPLTPNFGQLMQGMLSGQVSDPKAAMQDLQDRTEAELERAIAAAQEKGAEVTRDDFVFANWDPTKDYSKEDYEEVQG